MEATTLIPIGLAAVERLPVGRMAIMRTDIEGPVALKRRLQEVPDSPVCRDTTARLDDAPGGAFAPGLCSGPVGVGRILKGRYRIDSELGAGMSGWVWRATDCRTGEAVAVKVLHPHLRRESQYVRRFRREACLDIDDARVVRMLDHGDEGDDIFMVMEFVGGGTLADLMARGPVPVGNALAIVRDIAEGLAAVHARGITHRDVKPRNVLLGGDGRAKLSDFGIARHQDTSGLTGCDVFLGTPRYAPPELFTGRSEARSDLYSLGVVLYELLMGKPPFDADTPAGIMEQHLRVAPPRIHEVATRNPGAAWLINRLLAKNPSERFESARALVSAIDAVATCTSPSPARNGPRSQSDRATGRPHRFLLAAAIVIDALRIGANSPRKVSCPSG